MFRLILTCILLLLSLLTVLPAPILPLWYVAIMVGEFPWIFVVVAIALLLWGLAVDRYRLAGTIAGIAALLLLLVPVVNAYRIGRSLDAKLDAAFGPGTAAITGFHKSQPFSAVQMITGIGAKEIPYTTHTYDTANKLTLDYYPAQQPGIRPCVVVVHGGSWQGGDSRQLPELNSYLSKAGYNVVSLNYRLAPQYLSPAPVQDVHTALQYLRANAATMHIDTTNFVLLGRSAGGQIVLSAAYAQHEPGVKGVISYYGPADMIWGYHHPANPLVFNSCDVMEKYLGGTYAQQPAKYKESSPIEDVSPASIPTLLIHGQNDVLVAYQHSPRLVEKLQQSGTKYFLLTMPWATHGCDYTLNGPAGQLATYTVERFLKGVTK